MKIDQDNTYTAHKIAEFLAYYTAEIEKELDTPATASGPQLPFMIDQRASAKLERIAESLKGLKWASAQITAKLNAK